MSGLLKDKIAVVTGGSRGIGKAIVEDFLQQGATVYFNYNSKQKAANELIESLHKKGMQNVYAFQCNVSDSKQIKIELLKIKKQAGRLDILVNNAGITRDNFLMVMSDEEWDSVMKTNLYGVFNTTRAASRIMGSQKSGAIVNVASVAAIHGAAGQANYSASKGGIIAFTKSSAIELMEKGIRVNCILPGFIYTDMTCKISSDIRENLAKKIPIGRMGKPQEVAQLATYLASDRAAYIVGQSFVIDGGLTHGSSG